MMSSFEEILKEKMAAGDDAEVERLLRQRAARVWHRSGQVLALNLVGLELTALPEALARFGDTLEMLLVSGNKLQALPEALQALTGLQVVDLKNNKLDDLPAWIGAWANLNEINLSGNGMTAFPMNLFRLPALHDVAGIKGFARGKERAALELFLKRTGGTPFEKRQRLWAVYQDKDLGAVPTGELVEALRGNFPELAEKARAALLARSAKAPLGAGAAVAILGNVNLSKTGFKAAVEALGAAYHPKPTGATTHFVLGRSPAALEGLDGRALTFLTEEEAGAMVTASPAPALQPEVARAPAAEAAHTENLNQMLWSRDPATVDTALELVKAEGIAEGTITALFVVAKLHPDDKLRARARTLLKRHGSKAVQDVIADRDKLAYDGDKAERNTADSLRAFQRRCPEIDWIAVARFIHGRTGYGLSFAVQAAAPALRLELLRAQITQPDTAPSLDLHAVMSPRYKPAYLNSHSYYDGAPMPAWVFDLVELQELSAEYLLYTSIPPEIARMKNLKVLRLSGNMLSDLPDALDQLTGLRELYVGMNAFGALPPVLLRMPWLRVVDVQGNRAGSDSHRFQSIEVGDNVRGLMPGCRFVDGLNASQRQHATYYP